MMFANGKSPFYQLLLEINPYLKVKK